MAAPILRPYAYSPEELQQIDILTEQLLHFGEEGFDPLAGPSGDSRDRKVDPKVKKLVRSHAYTVPLASTSGSSASGSAEVKSWNLNEFAYKRDPCPFPTRARGLFTEEAAGKVQLGKGKHRIVARGYDKFFNVGEVGWTKWETLPEYTQGPYYLTLKTNGCIIFISALTPSQLLITSKHAIGSARNASHNPLAEYEGKEQTAEAGAEAEEEPPEEEEAIASGIPSDGDRRTTFDKLTHAGVGEFWLEQHLSAKGLSRTQLAKELWDAKVTAVAELTDDSFEEHVLPTPASQTGLNLHGLNRNFAGGIEGSSVKDGKAGGTSELETFDMEVVDAFAKKWGLHPTPFKKVSTMEEVRGECERVEKDGWGDEGIMVEGIVVRGSPKGSLPRSADDDQTVKGAKFWKVKYAEPYLMYREWRELTRRLMAERKKLVKEWNGKQPRQNGATQSADQSRDNFLRQGFSEKVHVDQIKNPQSRLYVYWIVEQLLTRSDSWFDEWGRGRAIVSTREDFFAWRETEGGKTEAARLGVAALGVSDDQRKRSAADDVANKPSKTFDKTLLVPIAAPGCGKTVLGVALTAYLGSSHTQSDDVTAKKTAAGFVRNVKELLLKPSDDSSPGSRIVFADKNNHLRTHRQAMGELVSELERGVPQGTPKKAEAAGKKAKGKQAEPPTQQAESIKNVNVRLVALVWDVEAIPQDEFHRLAAARIVERGENHQSLRPERTPEGIEAHEFILWRFLKDFQYFEPALSSEDNAFDDVIDMRVRATPTEALRTVVERLRTWHPDIPQPTEARLKAAIDAVKEYEAGIRKKMTLDQRAGGPRYFAIAIPLDLRGYVEEALRAHPSVDRTLFDQLVEKNRFTVVPHMTLLHSQDVNKSDGAEKKEKEEMWQHYKETAVATKPGEASVEVTLGPRLVWNDRVMAAEVSSVGPEELVRWTGRSAAHVTIGTIKEEVRPIEGKHLLEAVLGGDESAKSAQVLEIPVQHVKGVIKGLF